MANSKSFKIAQKTAFEAKGRQHMAGEIIQRLFNIDFIYTYLAIYRYISLLQKNSRLHTQIVWAPCD